MKFMVYLYVVSSMTGTMVTGDGLADTGVPIHAVFGVEHIFDLADPCGSEGYPVISIMAQEGGNGVGVVANQQSSEGFDCRGTRSDELVNLLFGELVPVSGRPRKRRTYRSPTTALAVATAEGGWQAPAGPASFANAANKRRQQPLVWLQ